ncbi:LysR family transcriptional regulator [Streptomyces chartreusis]|uniref:LysR family transcriptional regulator n=1 Tax=Streptomyces chartreusis TaxID=1969 RepID=UPI003820BEC0
MEALAEVARLGSYRAAAKSLGYTQPAISYRMRALERALGVTLAVKSGRSAQLTPAGIKLARRAEGLLASLRAVEREFQRHAGAAGQGLTIAAIRSANATIIPRAVARLHAECPGVAVTLTEASCADSYSLLRAGHADLALMWEMDSIEAGQRLLVPDPEMLRIPLAVDRKCVLLPLRHALAARESVRLEDLANEYWVIENDRLYFQEACRSAGFQPRVIATTDDQHTMRNLVARGVGVAMTDGLGVAASSPSEDVAVCLLDECPPRHIFGLVWPDMAKLPAVAALIEALRSTTRESFPDQPVGAQAAWVSAL